MTRMTQILLRQQIQGNKNTECVQLVKMKNQLKLNAKLAWPGGKKSADPHSSQNIKSDMSNEAWKNLNKTEQLIYNLTFTHTQGQSSYSQESQDSHRVTLQTLNRLQHLNSKSPWQHKTSCPPSPSETISVLKRSCGGCVKLCKKLLLRH